MADKISTTHALTDTRGLPKVVREFLHAEASGGIVLLVGAAIALIWANSPWSESYFDLFHTEVSLQVGSFTFEEDLQHFINDALMAIFFFVVGLEIKREFVTGELRSLKTASLPIIAALGGMVVPAAIYLLVSGPDSRHGWGVPMATDIAFAVGVVALLGSRVPSSLKLFLLTLAVADDLGAIAVIAIFYSSGVNLVSLAVAGALIGVMAVLRWQRVVWIPIFVILGTMVWFATYQSGVHATIAGALLGLLAPARPQAPAAVAREWAAHLSADPDPAELRAMTKLANRSVSVAERLEHMLHPVSSFLIIPVFALANAGVAIEADALSAPGASQVVLAVALGLVVGKTLGISLFSWVAIKLGIGTLPKGATWPQVVGVAAAAGIGFTVSLFIAGLAFERPEFESASKIGIIGASLVASVLGAFLLSRGGRRHPSSPDSGAATPSGVPEAAHAD